MKEAELINCTAGTSGGDAVKVQEAITIANDSPNCKIQGTAKSPEPDGTAKVEIRMITPHKRNIHSVESIPNHLLEFFHPWRVLLVASKTRNQVKQSPLASILNLYETNDTPPMPTFPSEVTLPPFLQQSTSPDMKYITIETNIQLAIGWVEPLYCRLALYDLSHQCRVTEEFHFVLKEKLETSDYTECCSSAYTATFPVFPANMSDIYAVIKISKVLQGDGDIATSLYCSTGQVSHGSNQDKNLAKARDIASDCTQRLGQYRQLVGWGASCLNILQLQNEENNETQVNTSACNIQLYRQRGILDDEQRMGLIPDAANAILKEKTIQGACTLNITYHSDCGGELQIKKASESQKFSPQLLQSFCPPSIQHITGRDGCGPIAHSVSPNLLYVYPISLLKLNNHSYRNITIHTQLLEKETMWLSASNDDLKDRHWISYTDVQYHCKSPSFDREVRFELPFQLTSTHHVLFTIYHIHCKKNLGNEKQQQELVGYAVLPILVDPYSNAATVIQNEILHTLPIQLFKSTKVGSLSDVTQNHPHRVELPVGYVEAARMAELNKCSSSKSMAKACLKVRTNIISSIYTQNPTIGKIISISYPPLEDNIPSSSVGISQKHQLQYQQYTQTRNAFDELKHCDPNECKFYFLLLSHQILKIIRYSTIESLRDKAFCTLLDLLEICNDVLIFKTASGQNALSPRTIESANVKRYSIIWSVLASVIDEKSLEPLGEFELWMTQPTSVQIDEVCSTIRICKGTDAFPQSLAQGILMQWHNLLDKRIKDSHYRLSLLHGPLLLEVIAKLLILSDKDISKGQTLDNVADVGIPHGNEEIILKFLETFLPCLTTQRQGIGLIQQKELNTSLAMFVRRLFILNSSKLPYKIVEYYKSFILNWSCQDTTENSTKCDPTGLLHFLFPFLKVLADYEFLGADLVEMPCSKELIEYTEKNAIDRPGIFLVHIIVSQMMDVVKSNMDISVKSAALQVVQKILLSHNLFEEAENQHFDQERLQQYNVARYILKILIPYFSDLTQPMGILDSVNALRFLYPAAEKFTSQDQREWVLRKDIIIVFVLVVQGCSVNGLRDLLRIYQSKGISAIYLFVSLFQSLVSTFLIPKNHIWWPHILSPSQTINISSGGRRKSLQYIENKVQFHKTSMGSIGVGQMGAIHHQHTSSMPSSLKALQSNSQAKRTTQASIVNKTYPPTSVRAFASFSVGHAQSSEKISTMATTSACGKVMDPSVTNFQSSDNDLDKNIIPFQKMLAEITLTFLTTTIGMFHHPSTPNESKLIQSHYNDISHVSELLFCLLSQSFQLSSLNGSTQGGDLAINVDSNTLHQTSTLDNVLLKMLTFLHHFQRQLFHTACKSGNLSHTYPQPRYMGDQYWVQLLFSIASDGKNIPISTQQTVLQVLQNLFIFAFNQNGHFLQIKAGCNQLVLKLGLLSRHHIDQNKTITQKIQLKDVSSCIERLAQSEGIDGENLTEPFWIHYNECLAQLQNQINVLLDMQSYYNEVSKENSNEQSDTSRIHICDELILRAEQIRNDISWHWLPSLRKQWNEVIIQLSETAGDYMEATNICIQEAHMHNQIDKDYTKQIKMYENAANFARKAQWYDKERHLYHELLNIFSKQKMHVEYVETLERLKQLVQLQPLSKQSYGPPFNFYRVQIITREYKHSHTLQDKMSEIKREYIYRRARFVSLRDFKIEIESQYNWYRCNQNNLIRKVIMLADNRALLLPSDTEFDRGNTSCPSNLLNIYIRINTVETVQSTEESGGQWFQYSIPYVITSNSLFEPSYGSTSEQFTKEYRLKVPHAFPTTTACQEVVVCRETVRSPIETATQDILKRSRLLQMELYRPKEEQEFKTLSMILLGSVDPQVHGGIPTILQAFFQLTNSTFHPVMGTHQVILTENDSNKLRARLADALTQFVLICAKCLVLSRQLSCNMIKLSEDRLPSSTHDIVEDVSGTVHEANDHTIEIHAKNTNETDISPLQLELESRFHTLVRMIQEKTCTLDFSMKKELNQVVLHEIQIQTNIKEESMN